MRFKEPVLNFLMIRNKIKKFIGDMSLILVKFLYFGNILGMSIPYSGAKEYEYLKNQKF